MTHIIPLTNITKIEQAIQFYTNMLNFKILDTLKDEQGNLVQVVLARSNNRIVITKQDFRDDIGRDKTRDETGSQICLLVEEESNIAIF